jgi:hypothetical protein
MNRTSDHIDPSYPPLSVGVENAKPDIDSFIPLFDLLVQYTSVLTQIHTTV